MKKKLLALIAVVAMAFSMTSCMTTSAVSAMSDGTAISAANFSYVSTVKAEADCKPFDPDLVREKTRNILACGLCWRLGDPRRTWDICSIEDIDFFGDLVRQHYASKKIPAKYI